MFRYFIRRLLWTIPVLLAVSLLTFALSLLAPGDPVRSLFEEGRSLNADPFFQINQYGVNAAQFGADLPAFYLSLQPAALPDTLHRVFPPERRERLRQLTLACGSWPTVSAFDFALLKWIQALNNLPDTVLQAAEWRLNANSVVQAKELGDVDFALQKWRPEELPQGLLEPFAQLRQTFEAVKRAAPNRRRWGVSVVWHGLKNRYHRWFTGFVRGELGRSTITRRPVAEELYPALLVTLALNGVALLSAFIVSVLLGVLLARRKGGVLDRWGQMWLLVLYAMPTFWLGGLLILLFATPDVGLYWLKGSSVQAWSWKAQSFGHWFGANAAKLSLPIAALGLHVLALLTLQMRGSLLRTMAQPFVRTAFAKGLPDRKVWWRHGVPQAIFPMIALLARLLPAVFGGALVLEYLFQVPGMGAKTQEAFLGRDYPVLFAVTMLSATVTILANLIADLLYASLDPRVKY